MKAKDLESLERRAVRYADDGIPEGAMCWWHLNDFAKRAIAYHDRERRRAKRQQRGAAK